MLTNFAPHLYAETVTSFIKEEVHSESIKNPIDSDKNRNSEFNSSSNSIYVPYEEANKKNSNNDLQEKRLPASPTTKPRKIDSSPDTKSIAIEQPKKILPPVAQNPQKLAQPIQPVPPEIEQKDMPVPYQPQVITVKESGEKIDGVKLLKEFDVKGFKAKMAKEEVVKLIYYVEVRYQNKLTISKQPVFFSEPIHFLKAGQIIKIEDTVDGYLDKLRLEKKGLGVFKPFTVFDPKDIHNEKSEGRKLYVYDDFTAAYTISPFEQPVTMMPVFTVDWPVIPVYSQPGKWTTKDCDEREDLCVGWLDHYSTIYLLDTRVVFNEKKAPSERLENYYYIGYEYKLPTGDLKRGSGWVASSFLQRKIETVTTQLVASRNPATEDFMLPANAESSSLFIFGKNRKQTEKLNKFTQNMTEKRARELASIWSIKLDFEGQADMTNSKITHSWLDQPINLYGPSAGLHVAAPIFLDLVIKGSAKLTVPGTSSQTDKKPFLFKTEEWLEVTTPWNLEDMPIKAGLGAYYFTMLNTDSSYGVNSLLGIQFRVLYENNSMWTYAKYAPIGESLKLSAGNRDIGVGLGYKMKKNDWFDTWGIFGEYIDLSYTSPAKNTTIMQQSNLGVFFSF